MSVVSILYLPTRQHSTVVEVHVDCLTLPTTRQQGVHNPTRSAKACTVVQNGKVWRHCSLRVFEGSHRISHAWVLMHILPCPQYKCRAACMIPPTPAFSTTGESMSGPHLSLGAQTGLPQILCKSLSPHDLAPKLLTFLVVAHMRISVH